MAVNETCVLCEVKWLFSLRISGGFEEGMAGYTSLGVSSVNPTYTVYQSMFAGSNPGYSVTHDTLSPSNFVSSVSQTPSAVEAQVLWSAGGNPDFFLWLCGGISHFLWSSLLEEQHLGSRQEEIWKTYQEAQLYLRMPSWPSAGGGRGRRRYWCRSPAPCRSLSRHWAD